ncbi:MAG TPA: ATP-binding protein [Verrucomicrobiae bacterium]|nr:ATP-binding protein [Verrucomicrobiae bacterium]
MIRLRSFINASLRTKVLVPMMVCMAAMMAVTGFLVNRSVTRQFEKEGRERLTIADAKLQYLLKTRSEDLLLRFRTLPNEPRYRAAFQLADGPTLHQPLADLLGEHGADIVFYTSNVKKVLAVEKRDPLIHTAAFETAARDATDRALEGQETVDTVRAGARLYDVVAIPVYVNHELIGVMTLGLEIGAAEVQKFSQLTRSHIALLAGGRVIAASLAGPEADSAFVNLFTNTTRSTDSSTTRGRLTDLVLDGQHHFGMTGRFDSLGADATLGYVLLSSYESSLRALAETQHSLLVASLCMIIVGATTAWWLINKATQPLRELRDSVEAVGRGDLSRRVEVKSEDECGELARVYNQMTENLSRSREQLEHAHAELVESSRLAGKAEVATSVLHNVRNVLTSVNIASSLMAQGLKHSKAGQLAKVVTLLSEHRENLGAFLTQDPKGMQIPDYLAGLSKHLVSEQEAALKELAQLQKGVEHIMEIVKAQQSYAKTSGARETVRADDLLTDALRMNALPASGVKVIKEVVGDISLTVEKHKALQILVNLIRNAHQACEAGPNEPKICRIVASNGGPRVRFEITDNGVGIDPANLNRIFAHGFTTKKDGHGFGLHNSAAAARELGGELRVRSDGPGHGATFTLELPA